MASIKTFIAVLVIITGYIVTGRAQTVDTEPHLAGNRNLPEREEWLRDRGFGMFIHFSHDAQLGTVISHSVVGASKDYLDRYFNELPQSFNPYKFDADRLAGLAKLAGMKYVVFTTKHHNGFCFWDTKTTDFSIMNTPYGKDLLAELIGGFRRAGLGIGLYYSPEDFWFLYENDVIIRRKEVEMDEKTRRKYDRFIEKQTEELFSNYGKIDVLFIDSEMKEVCMETAYRIQPELVITRGAVITPEQYIPGLAMDWLWESNATMGTQWNYKPTNDDVKSGAKLIELLIEARAKGGNFLLNVGPHPEGNLPYEYETELREVAAWYFINHEAIENVRPWIMPNEENIWFTASKDRKSVYAAIIDHDVWPRCERREFVLGSVEATVDTRISVLGQNDLVCEYNPDADPESRFEQKEDGLHISIMRAQRIYNNHKWPNPVVVKLENVKPALEPLSVETHEAVINDNSFVDIEARQSNQRVPENYNLSGGVRQNWPRIKSFSP